jgi:RNA polymerase sigma-54 factor
MLAKVLNTTSKNVQIAIRFISENLNPYPARAHWGDVRSPTQSKSFVYHQPDVLIYPYNNDINNPLVIEVILPLSGTLRINPMFKSAIRNAESDKRDEWRSDLEKANLFIKCIQQRNYTIVRLMEKVATLQRDFIVNGEKYLIPVTRAKIAKELNVHESTISRAVGNKTVQLPNRRIIPLSSFFDRSLNIRTIVKEIISNESEPLSDAEIVDLLGEKGVNVARRTVAKYRAMEGILPAYMRSTVA